MKLEVMPTKKELEQHAEIIPEIKPASILAMLSIMQAYEKIKSSIQDVLEKKYQLSEGKLRIMIILHQHPEGTAPSFLARHAGVTKATISVMLRRMIRDHLINSIHDISDGRSKKITLTPQGRQLMDTILPEHYLRISKVMENLTEEEQNELIRLLTKIADI